MTGTWTDADLLAFLDESLPVDMMADIEAACRDDRALRKRLATVRGREDAGLHTIGAIWRRHRLSCPDRRELGQFLLGVLDDDADTYIRFHLKRVGCRACQANLDDLQVQQQAVETATATAARRTRYFQSSAGYLRGSSDASSRPQ